MKAISMIALLIAALGLWLGVFPKLPTSSCIGKTQNQIAQSYGKSMKTKSHGVEVECFKVQGWVVVTNFLNDVCWSVDFLKVPNRFGIGKPLSNAEIQRLLSINSGGQHWRTTVQGTVWQTDDSNLTAIYNSQRRDLFVTVASKKYRPNEPSAIPEKRKFEHSILDAPPQLCFTP